MPRAKLPSTVKGWFVALAGALAGLVAGFVVVDFLGKRVK